MLDFWLVSKSDTKISKSNLNINRINEKEKNKEKIKKYVKTKIQENFIDSKKYENYAKKLGWKKTESFFVTSQIPTLPLLQKGLFGEVLDETLLEEFFNYLIPIKKNQYKITLNQSLPSTDFLAIKDENEKITEVCFCETKLRLKNDNYVAKNGFKQLKKDRLKKMPDMVSFLMKRLDEQNHPLSSSFLDYLFDRGNDILNKETQRLGIINEETEWNEDALIKLSDEIKDDETLIVDLVLIKELRKTLEDTYELLGVSFNNE